MGTSSENFEVYATYLSQFFLVFGAILPYIPQYLEIAKTGDASGFSTLVCFVLLLANTLRIVYWLGHYFDEALLLQSVVVIITMFVMLNLCIRMNRLRAQSEARELEESTFFDSPLSKFWKWTTLSSYFQATLLMAILAAGTLFIFKNIPAVVEGIGYAALLVESCLAMPQFIQNYQSRSVQGMNVMMVVLWTVGDAFKGYFYIWKQQPLPFIICASIQLAVDLAIFGEILLLN